MIIHIVGKIRKEYDPDVPIVLTTDTGFFDQENFRAFEKLGIGYVCGGKLYDDIAQRAQQIPEEDWQQLGKEDGRCYLCTSFGDQRAAWDKPRKVVFTRLTSKDHQGVFPFAQDRKVYYTNLGECESVDRKLKAIGKASWLTSLGIVSLAHGRGKDELRHRALKEFGTEKLPFKRFAPNTAFYYTMLLAFNLMEAFKRDVTEESICPDVCPATFRRMFLDIAGKRSWRQVTASSLRCRVRFGSGWICRRSGPKPIHLRLLLWSDHKPDSNTTFRDCLGGGYALVAPR